MFRKIIKEYELGVEWHKGAIVGTLQPGVYRFSRRFGRKADIFDTRQVVLRIPGQEVILGDHTSLKTNITGVYRIAKPAILLQKIARTDLQEHITQLIQLRVREVLSSKSLDELMEKREAASLELDEKIKREFADIGLELIDMKIKDIILPAELRNAYIEAFSARLRSQAQLEQARGQSAALRNLANTADLLEKHPQLLQLMSLQKKDSNLNLHFDQVTTKK